MTQPTQDARDKPLRLAILGTRGIPARHGGFETFAEFLAVYLVERGWDVTVYCQSDVAGEDRVSTWKGVTLHTLGVSWTGSPGSILFDWKSTWRAAAGDRLVLVLGYNTAIFSILYWLRGRTHVFNMDGIEWKRAKWSKPIKAWFYINERIAYRLGDVLIADHPQIARHLTRRVGRRAISVIPYGSRLVRNASPDPLAALGVEPGQYALVVARAEPENSIREIVQAFSRVRRAMKLVVLGTYAPDTNPYHREVLSCASEDVLFPGAIYDPDIVDSLRCHCALYVHGHQVGGTNPSLVEAMGAGNPVLAHDNPFNRWVAGDAQAFFADTDTCAARLDVLLENPDLRAGMAEQSRLRHAEAFTWDHVLAQYEALLTAAAKGKRASIRRPLEETA